MKYPKIRAISAFPVKLPEGQFICLQDPNRYLENPVIVSPETFSVIQFFDGNHSFPDIQEAYMRRYGMLVYTEQIQQIVEQLDQYHLLESPAFFAYLEGLRLEFAEMPVRPSSHQGTAYPEEKAALCHQFDRYFTDANGPGKLLDPICVEEQKLRKSSSTLKGLMAPHIDINAGGPTFAWAYHALSTSNSTLFVILGTSHVDMQNFFALTRKSFETPFGRVETDQAFVDALVDRLPYDPFEDELIHKREHSIEFQIIFLQYLREKMGWGVTPMKIVPILCGGSMHEAIRYNRSINQVPQLEESINGLRHVLDGYRQACVIASVDFSHIGIRYGDSTAPDPEKLAMVERIDRGLLTAMEQVDHEKFVAQLRRHHNMTQVCGVVPIYTLLRLLDGTRGRLLHYDRTELSPGSFVSFASMSWETEA